MQPLVSICIPTYNRADSLMETITSVVKQPEFLSGKVELVISDNASTDNTSSVCAQYIKYPNFVYNRNKENVRDRNFPIVISKASGKLRKLHNDTLVLKEGSLKKLCQVVEDNYELKPVIFLTNKEEITSEKDFHDFVMELGYRVTWIGSHTFWEEDIKKTSDDYDGCELSLWQVRKTYDIAFKKNKAKVVGGCFAEVKIPQQKNVSYGLFKVFYINYFKMLEPYLNKGIFSKADKELLEKQLLFEFFLPWAINYEAINNDIQYSKEEDLCMAIRNKYIDKPYWREYKRLFKRGVLKTRIIRSAKNWLKTIMGRSYEK